MAGSGLYYVKANDGDTVNFAVDMSSVLDTTDPDEYGAYGLYGMTEGGLWAINHDDSGLREFLPDNAGDCYFSFESVSVTSFRGIDIADDALFAVVSKKGIHAFVLVDFDFDAEKITPLPCGSVMPLKGFSAPFVSLDNALAVLGIEGDELTIIIPMYPGMQPDDFELEPSPTIIDEQTIVIYEFSSESRVIFDWGQNVLISEV